MPTEKSISFRSHLLLNTSDLLVEIGLNCDKTSRLIGGIVSQLAAYTEEGVELAPTIYVCNSISDLLRRAGAGEHFALSNNLPFENAAQKILKAAAPLSGLNWHIYIERSHDASHCRYGVFSGSNDPSSFSIDEVVLDEYQEGFPIIQISQSATNKVEVRTNASSSIEFCFNDDIDEIGLNNRSHIDTLATSIASGTNPQSQAFKGYVRRLLARTISESYGTLVAVTESNSLPDELTDCVVLAPRLDLYERFQLHNQEGKTAISVSRLQVATELVGGIIRSDGVTVFSASGAVLAYRAFVKSTNPSPIDNGGARSRAFETMKELVKAGKLQAAFFRSQDGRTDVAVRNQGSQNG